jgi:hypothetical protein
VRAQQVETPTLFFLYFSQIISYHYSRKNS